VSPQFHAVFDDYFTTTKCLHTNELPPSWPTLLATSSEKFVDDSFDSTPFIDSSWFSDTPTATQRENIHSSLSPFQREDTISNHQQTSATSSSSSESDHHSLPPDSSNPNPTLRSGWNPCHNYNTRFKQHHSANLAALSFNDNSSETPFDESQCNAFISIQDSYPIKSSTDLSFLEHYACTAKSNHDVLHYGAMLKDPDRPSFETDMQREVSDLLRTETVEITPRSIVPYSGLKILQAIWSFRHKRAPDWSIIKYKSRLCPHGGQQIEGEHFWETYSPVINWRTVRLVLIAFYPI
jgi:hypothetical protein